MCACSILAESLARAAPAARRAGGGRPPIVSPSGRTRRRRSGGGGGSRTRGPHTSDRRVPGAPRWIRRRPLPRARRARALGRATDSDDATVGGDLAVSGGSQPSRVIIGDGGQGTRTIGVVDYQNLNSCSTVPDYCNDYIHLKMRAQFNKDPCAEPGVDTEMFHHRARRHIHVTGRARRRAVIDITFVGYVTPTSNGVPLRKTRVFDRGPAATPLATRRCGSNRAPRAAPSTAARTTGCTCASSRIACTTSPSPSTRCTSATATCSSATTSRWDMIQRRRSESDTASVTNIPVCI